MNQLSKNPGPLYAFLAALLFGASTPAAKPLLSYVDPWFLAGLLYFGSGLGLLFLQSWLRLRPGLGSQEVPLKRADFKWLALAVLFGGMFGPVLLMNGLATSEATTASLLLNLEGVLTALLAWFVFSEHFDRRIALGMLLIVLGGLVLSWSGKPGLAQWEGPIFIAFACFAWAVDNNVTRKISASNPLQIAIIKSLFAGTTNLILAAALGAQFPSISILGWGALVGFFGYGLSLVCFILALRHMGAARSGAYFSLAPFVGALLSLLVSQQFPSIQMLLAGALMGWGVYLHLTEKHSHEHTHEAVEHEHSHRHDEHHQHEHDAHAPQQEPHSHRHRHEPLRHKHPHYPDVDHRHSH